MQIRVNVTVQTDGADRLIAGLSAMQTGSPPPPVQDMFNVWGRRIEAFTKKRFEVFSRGGGDWPPLALSTVRKRRGPRMDSETGRGYGGRGRGFGGFGEGGRTSLARDTKRGGQFVSAGRTVTILRDTGVLFKALTIGQPGSTFELIPSGVRYGVGGNQRHAGLVARVAGKAASVKSPSIGDIASFHQFGSGRLPKREIIVVPDQSVLDNMAKDAERAAARLMG